MKNPAMEKNRKKRFLKWTGSKIGNNWCNSKIDGTDVILNE